MKIINSVLYIDFDNMAISLDRKGLLEQVLDNLDVFLEYLTRAEITDKLYENTEAIRLFNKKIIFFNPRSFGKYELIFKQSGFITIPCPVVTMFNKTSTDMYLAVEVMKDIHTKNYEDYIIVSADVDFAPILLYVNSHGRKTIQLGFAMQNRITQGAATISLDYNNVINALLEKSDKPVTKQVIVKNINDESGESETCEKPEKEPKYQEKEPFHSEPQVKIISKPESVPTKKPVDDLETLIDSLFDIPILDPELQKKILLMYSGCKTSGIQKRFINNSVMARIQKSDKELKKGNTDYNNILRYVRFITKYFNNSKSIFSPEPILEGCLNTFFASETWRKVYDEYQISITDVKKYIKV